MTTTRDFAADYFTARMAARALTATLSERAAAERKSQRILDAADRAGVNLYRDAVDIDEAARIHIYGA